MKPLYTTLLRDAGLLSTKEAISAWETWQHTASRFASKRREPSLRNKGRIPVSSYASVTEA